MELTNLIDQLENLISSGTGVPATGRIFLEKEKLANLIQALKMLYRWISKRPRIY